MKIAICFSGQIRTAIETYSNFRRYIGDMIENCDIFIHTWDVESISQHDYRLDTEKYVQYRNKTLKVDREKLTKFYGLYKPVSITVENYNLLNTTDTWGGRRHNPKFTNKTVSMFESIYESNNLKKYYENKYDFKYDYVIRTRTDIVFDKSKSLKDDLNYYSEINNNGDKKLLFGDPFNLSHQFHNRVEDIFWIADSTTMDIATEFYLYRANSPTGVSSNQGGYLDWQFDLWNYLSSNSINSLPLKNSIMRIYYQSDIDLNNDTMDVKFGNPPGWIIESSHLNDRPLISDPD